MNRKKRIKSNEISSKKFWVWAVVLAITGVLLGILFGAAMSGNIIRRDVGTINMKGCTDSDNGFNVAKQGICNDGRGNLVDRCLREGTKLFLYEYSCEQNKCVEKKVDCADYGYSSTNQVYTNCYKGACRNR